MECTIILIKMKDLTSIISAEGQNQFVCRPTLPMGEGSYLQPMEVCHLMLICLRIIWAFQLNQLTHHMPLKIIIG